MDHIFLGSVGRSGTSILAEVIAQVPQALYFRESRIFTDNDSLKGLLTARITVKKFKQNLLSMYRIKTIGNLKRDKLPHIEKVYSTKNVIIAISTKNIFNAIQNFYRLGLIYYKKNVLVEKTPHNITQAHIINLIFPNCKFINIYRDPRDVYSSILTKSWGPKKPTLFVNWYNDILDRAERSLSRLSKENVLTIKFEDLIYHKQKKLEKVFDFVKLKYNPEYANIITEEKAHINRFKKDITKEIANYIYENCKK